MITKINLENFTVFSKLSLEFSPRVNVIIGENGTGKTHLLKASYFLCTGGSAMNGGFSNSDEKINVAFTDRLLRLFMPIENKIGKLRSYGARPPVVDRQLPASMAEACGSMNLHWLSYLTQYFLVGGSLHAETSEPFGSPGPNLVVGSEDGSPSAHRAD